MLAGMEAAHALAYRLVFPQASLRTAMLAASGHGYAAWLPLALGVAGALAIVAVAAAVVDVARGGRVRELGAGAFALLPPLAFALQELLELSLHTGGIAWHAFAAPTFLPGLALQLPFALLAFLVTRALLRAAVRIGRPAARPRPRRAIIGFRNDCDLLESGSQRRPAAPRAPPLAVGI